MASPRPLTDEEMMAEEIRPLTDEEMGEGDTSVSKGTSAVRGAAQGVTMGFADEAMGALGVPVQKAMDAITGNKENENVGLKELYQRLRDDERMKDKSAKEANPKAYMGGEFAGGMASAVIPGAQGQTAAKLAALGGIQGAGNSEADLTEGDFVGAGRDTAIGGTLGVVAGKGLPVAAKGAVRIGGKLMDGAGWAGKKAISTIFGPSMEAIDARFANPDKIKNAKSYSDLADELPETLGKVSDQIKKDDKAAWATLSDSNYPAEMATNPAEGTAVPKQKFINLLKHLKRETSITGGGTVGKVDAQARATLEGIINDIENVGSSNPKKLKSLMGVSSILKENEYLSEKQMREIIQALDSNIDWDDPMAGKTNEVLEAARSKFDDILKSQNPEYAKAMAPLADKTDLLMKAKRAFNIKDETGVGMVPTDTTASKLQSVTGEKRAVSQDVLARLKALTGRDYLDESETYRLAKEFEGGRPQGSRRVNLGGILGGGSGFFVGGAPGTVMGSIAGGSAGAYLDKEGGKVAGKIIDSTVAGGKAIEAGKKWLGDKIPDLVKSNPQVLGKYAPAFANAMRQGAQQVGLTHWLLMNNDQEYREMISGLEKEGER